MPFDTWINWYELFEQMNVSLPGIWTWMPDMWGNTIVVYQLILKKNSMMSNKEVVCLSGGFTDIHSYQSNFIVSY